MFMELYRVIIVISYPLSPEEGGRRKETEVARRIKEGNEKEGDRSSRYWHFSIEG